MPRLTDRSRRERRDDIAMAAMRVLAREGVANTSIAQIVAESGRSSGAIYSHFRNKAELAHYIADRMLGWRIEAIEDRAAAGESASPADVMRWLLVVPSSEQPDVRVLLQFWAEATTDPEMLALVTGKMLDLRRAFARAITPWAESRSNEPAVFAERTASAMIALCQGWLANSGLLGWLDAEEYIAAATGAFAPQ